MKFTWFNLMPWPYLPDDFREKYHSVWVDIPNKLYDPQKGHFVYHEYMDQLEYAESVGFDGIGCNEHHQNGYGLMPSPNIIAAGLSRRTSKAAIAVIGNSLALYNPPIRVAEEFAMLDVMSGGRLLAGFPVGTSMDTNYCYGQIPALTRDKYAEAHELVMRAWAEEEPFAFDGKYNQLRHVNCWPKPIQKPHPPIYIPGGGSIETWDFCLDHDYNYSYLSFTGYLRGKKLLDGYWNQVAKRGKDESPYRGAFAQTICVAETDQEAEKLYAEHVSYFYNRCLHIYGGFADAPGYRTIKTIQADVINALSEDMQNLFPSLSWKELVDGGYIIAGSPATVRDRMKDLIKGLHVGHIFCLIHVGNMPDWKTRYSTKLFAEKVIPELRDMWPEWKDDNRWWCKPMQERLHPETTVEKARQDGEAPVMKIHKIETKRGAKVRVLEAGSGAPLVFMHGAGGLFPENPFLDRLATRYHVFAPEFPAYGESTGDEMLEDMLDFTLHGWDVVAALGLNKPHLMGHSMGGMIAAEMASLAPNNLLKLVLVCSAGLWIEKNPIPDIFSFLPHEYAQYLFHDRAQGEALLTAGLDLKNPEALKEFYIGNSKRMSMAGKILFPIPNRRLSKRLYRLTAPTLLVWGKSDKLIPPVYADQFKKLIPQAEIVLIEQAGHMVPYEQPEAFVNAVTRFLG